MAFPPHTTITRQRLPYKWIVILVVVFGAFMTILDQTIVNIALPRLQTAFHAPLSIVQWSITAYILTQGVMTPTTAFFVNHLGAKRFYVLALAIFTLGSALCGLAWSLPALIIFRILQGIGGAFLYPVAITLVYREFPPQQRGTASAALGVASLLAPAIGPTLGGYLVTYSDWPYIFFINVPLGIIGIILGIWLLREVRPEAPTRFDLAGFVLAASGLTAFLYALSDASTAGWGSLLIVSLLVAGLLLLCTFVLTELRRARRGDAVLLDLRLFTNSPFIFSNIASALITFVFFGGLFLFPIYLQNLRGLSALQSGLLLLPQAFASIIVALIGGRLVDRFGARPVVIPGMLIMAFTLWQSADLQLTTSFWWLGGLYLLRGVALGLIIQPLNASALQDMRPHQFAQASSLYNVIRFVSTSLGVAILATLVQSQAKLHTNEIIKQALRTHSSPIVMSIIGNRALMQALQDAFWLSVVVALGGVLAGMFIRSQRVHDLSEEEKIALRSAAVLE
ncbi:MDR family MFS transporter [Dictyobacter kobayashii]|uniref:MFS transporter n=1 Tax=Dictyobacter kobayashii TaxID=2014872 RepID=A0A402ART0_9CHLR|nr:MDR family MFS transporter [Dictyobacter kobayashii]GCE21806.1 MFS transporter [Dictyobacter kobayashii]